MKIEDMIKKNGTVNYNGKTYVLTQQAYIDGSVDDPYYTAIAICPDEGVDEDGLYNAYQVTWWPTQEWLDGDREDEGDACDWDAADDIRQVCGYDLEDGSFV